MILDRGREIVRKFEGQSVCIVGDVMLDRYLWGDVRRISPEAPVPVVEVSRSTHVAGGAANVAVNIAELGGSVQIGSIVGDDESASILSELLVFRGVFTDGLVIDPHRPTSTKTRIMAHNQQLLRMDEESRAPVSELVADALFEWLGNTVSTCGCLVLSDYGKGVLSDELTPRLIKLASREGHPVIVDPKGTSYGKYAGATLITPNQVEAEKATGIEVASESDLHRCADALLKQLPGTAILITQGARGMSLFYPDGGSVHIPALARIVFDVTGAGDTVISVLALAMAADAPMDDAAALASAAAGIVVGKLGTSTVTVDELLEQLG